MRTGVGEIRTGLVAVGGSAVPAVGGLAAVGGILDGEAAAFEVLEVVQLNGFGCGGDILETYVTESVDWVLVVGLELIEGIVQVVERDW